jgi:hypothetical protein
MNTATASTETTLPPFTAAALPAIGAEVAGGKFAGVTLFNGERYGLIVLPADGEERSHAEAVAWAKAQGGELMTRIDAVVAYENLRDEFEADWYWLAETHPKYADCAWLQYFLYGSQLSTRKSDVFRCRAVRRVAI